MSRNIDSMKISCLLYFDRPMQADLSDFLSDLTPSRKGEVLREILENGWQEYKKNNGVGLNPNEFAEMIAEKQKNKNKNKPLRKTKKATKSSKDNNHQYENVDKVSENDVDNNEVIREDSKEKKHDNNNKTVFKDIEQDKTELSSDFSNIKTVSIDDIEDDDDDDDEVIDPLAKMKMKGY